jgi:hypothetical protein
MNGTGAALTRKSRRYGQLTSRKAASSRPGDGDVAIALAWIRAPSTTSRGCGPHQADWALNASNGLLIVSGAVRHNIAKDDPWLVMACAGAGEPGHRL